MPSPSLERPNRSNALEERAMREDISSPPEPEGRPKTASMAEGVWSLADERKAASMSDEPAEPPEIAGLCPFAVSNAVYWAATE